MIARPHKPSVFTHVVGDGFYGDDANPGGDARDKLYGAYGNDTLAGGLNNDTLFGGGTVWDYNDLAGHVAMRIERRELRN